MLTYTQDKDGDGKFTPSIRSSALELEGQPHLILLEILFSHEASLLANTEFIR